MTGKLRKSSCPSCGAPVSSSEHRQGYVCKYCGTEFYPEDELNLQPIFETPISKSDDEQLDNYEPLNPSIQKKKPLGVWIALVILGFILIASISGLFNSRSSASQRNPPTAVPKPAMLATLPKAVAAGKTVPFNNLEIYFEPSISISEKKIYFNFTVQNWDENDLILRYKPNNFIVYDDLGNSYPLHLGNCDLDIPYLDRQIKFDPYELIQFESSDYWCGQENRIPAYSGVIPTNAKQLYFHIDDFGVFKDITFVFDL